MNLITNIVCGDPWGEGHGQTATYTIISTHSNKKILEFYKAAVEKYGFDMTDFVKEYGQYNFTNEEREAFLSTDIDPTEDGTGRDLLELAEGTDDFFILFMRMVEAGARETGEQNFKWKYINPPAIDIGGYGFFV